MNDAANPRARVCSYRHHEALFALGDEAILQVRLDVRL